MNFQQTSRSQSSLAEGLLFSPSTGDPAPKEFPTLRYVLKKLRIRNDKQWPLSELPHLLQEAREPFRYLPEKRFLKKDGAETTNAFFYKCGKMFIFLD
jgi:hypothetical protein